MRIRHARLRRYRRRGLSALCIIGSCLGVYAVLAVAFRAWVEPSLGMSYASSMAPFPVVAPAPVTVPPPIAATPRRAFATTAPDTTTPNTTSSKTARVELVAEAKTAAKPTAPSTRHRRQARNRSNSFGFLFGASFGHRHWF
jgi:hypothetical protein